MVTLFLSKKSIEIHNITSYETRLTIILIKHELIQNSTNFHPIIFDPNLPRETY